MMKRVATTQRTKKIPPVAVGTTYLQLCKYVRTRHRQYKFGQTNTNTNTSDRPEVNTNTNTNTLDGQKVNTNTNTNTWKSGIFNTTTNTNTGHIESKNGAGPETVQIYLVLYMTVPGLCSPTTCFTPPGRSGKITIIATTLQRIP